MAGIRLHAAAAMRQERTQTIISTHLLPCMSLEVRRAEGEWEEDICVPCYHVYESLQVLDFFFHFFSFFSFFLHNKPISIIGSLILQMRKQAQRNNLPQNILFISDGGKKGKEQRGEENTRTGLFKTFKHNALNIKLFKKIIIKSRNYLKYTDFFKMY